MPGNRHRKIMIVEDEQIVARDLALMVEHMGYDVSAVIDTGREALEMAKKECPDLALMDIVLPGEIDGIEAASKLRKEHNLPIVYITAYADEETIQRAKMTEPLGYILKPFEEREIQTVIEIALYKSEIEGKLRRQEQLLSTILQSVESAVIAVDMNGIVQFVNPVTTLLTGWTGEEAGGRHISEILKFKRDETHTLSDNLLTIVTELSQSSGRPTELDLVSREGRELSIECTIKRIESGETISYGYVITFSDITRRKELQEQLLQVRKMDAVGRLAGGIAHDYNNMIGVILGFATRIKQSFKLLDPQRKDVEGILDAAQRCANLTKKLLTLASKQIVTQVPLNLNDAIPAMRQMIESAIGEDILLVLQPGKDLWDIKIDPVQVDQILSNLASNARDAIENSGTVTIETHNVMLDDEFCREHVEAVPGEYVALTFGDTGKGMEKDVLRQIFEPFFTTKQKGGGSGLGLATVFGIVKQNNGLIDVTSKPDQGTTFVMYFPRFYGKREKAVGGIEESSPGGTETLLIVEDEKMLLELLSDEMEFLGYNVLSANSPEEAILLCERHKKEIDVLITDMIMPGMNGKQLKEHVESVIPGLKVIFMSGYSADIVANHGIVEKDINFLQKPFMPIELARKVRNVLDR